MGKLNTVETLELRNNRNNIVPLKLKKVVLHEHPDLDGIAAYWLACEYDQIGFHGITNAKIEFWPQGPPPDGRTADEHEKEGTICFDVGEGRFDHHPHGKCLDKCATDLVAEFLGISDDIALKRILDYVRMQDLEGPLSFSRSLRAEGISEEMVEKAALLEVHSFVGIMGRIRRQFDTRRKFINWVCQQLTIFHQREIHFWTDVRDEFQRKARVWPMSNGTREYRIAAIESDIREVGSFSRLKEGGFCAVCVHRVPETGYVFISGTVSSEQFVEINKFLRVWEMKKRTILTDFLRSELTESRFKPCPVWYLPKNKYSQVFVIMNGGEKTAGSKEIEPTALTLEEIREAVCNGLDERILSEQCPRTHCLGYSCGFYPFGLARCEKIKTPGRSKQV